MKLSRVWESRTKTPNFELTWKQNDSVVDGGEEIETSSMLGRRKIVDLFKYAFFDDYAIFIYYCSILITRHVSKYRQFMLVQLGSGVSRHGV